MDDYFVGDASPNLVVDKVGVWCPLRDGRSQDQGYGRCECTAVQGEHKTGYLQSARSMLAGAQRPVWLRKWRCSQS